MLLLDLPQKLSLCFNLLNEFDYVGLEVGKGREIPENVSGSCRQYLLNDSVDCRNLLMQKFGPF
jgi:hypothetical protein